MEDKKHISAEQWETIAKHLYDGEGDGHDVQLDSQLYGENLREVTRTADHIDVYFRLKKFNSEKAFQKVELQLRRQKHKPLAIWLYQPLLKIVAVVVFAILLASFGFFLGNHPWGNPKSSGVVVDKYGISTIELADGTVVTLNHDTRINYPKRFKGDIREVYIEGEAFFQVQPDPDKPFVIHAGEASIKVLGTSFNVNAYREKDEVEVVVETGKVQLSNMHQETKQLSDIILDPGDKGVYNSSSKELRKNKNDNLNFLSWKTRNLIFDKTSIKEVVAQLNKVYRVQIITEDPQVDHLLLTARFEDRSLDFVLEVIALTHDLKVKRENDFYVLRRTYNEK